MRYFFQNFCYRVIPVDRGLVAVQDILVHKVILGSGQAKAKVGVAVHAQLPAEPLDRCGRGEGFLSQFHDAHATYFLVMLQNIVRYMAFGGRQILDLRHLNQNVSHTDPPATADEKA